MDIPCKFCNVKSASFRILKSHINLHHREVKRYECGSPGCGRFYGLFNSYRTHFLKCHFNSRIGNNNSALVIYPQTLPVAGPSSAITEDTQYVVRDKEVAESPVPITETLSKLLSNLYGNPQVPQNVVDDAFQGLRNVIYKSILPMLPANNSDVLAHIDNSFHSLQSKHKRFKFFEQSGTLICPQEYRVGQRNDFVKRAGRAIYESVPCVAHKVSLRIVLQKFFSMPKVLSLTLEYYHKLLNTVNGDIIENFIQGSFWKSRRELQHGQRIVLPLFLHVDDFEPLNPLGSHNSIHKLGAAYVSVGCLPSCYTSQLTSIFLILLYHSSDRVQFGNRVIFQPLIEEFNCLSRNGIHFQTEGFEGTIYFELGAVLGDYLGIHSIMGFVESFSGQFPCRMCKISKAQLQKTFTEDLALLRNVDNYARDLNVGNPTLSGIKEKCIWLDVDNFELFNQMGFDVMRDLYEGTLKYIMANLIVALIDKSKFFTLELFNNKLATFSYGPDKKDMPVAQSIENLRKGIICATASEMCVLWKYLGIMLGELVPRGDQYWDIYILTIQFLDIAVALSYRPNLDQYFKFIIRSLCTTYMSVFNRPLTPKFHYLLHYPTAMFKFGPLTHLSSMRYEGKHSPCKVTAKTTCNRRNMTLTIFTKHQLMVNKLFTDQALPESIHFSSLVKPVDSAEMTILAEKFAWSDPHLICQVPWVTVSSEKYAPSTVVPFKFKDSSVDFILINNIYTYKKHEIIFKAQKLQGNCFDDHLNAFNVTRCNDYLYLPYSHLQCPYPCNLVVLGYGLPPETYVVLRKKY